MRKELISLTVDLDQYGGAQKVMVDIHESLKLHHKAKVMGFKKFENLHPKYKLCKDEYVKFSNPFSLNNKILLVHSRNVMAIIMLMKWCFFLNTKILYIAHNVYDNLDWASFFPKRVISISDKVTKNLINYFKVDPNNIELIYNGIKDEAKGGYLASVPKDEKIIILYSARINKVKRQLEIVEKLNGKLDEGVEIHFAGIGPEHDELIDKCKDSKHFKVLGFVKDVGKVVSESDYLMLYSIQEGLPISLIEGAMFGKPLLVNDVGGNFEIGVPGQNAIALTNWESLADRLNSLKKIDSTTYQKMSNRSRQIFEEMFTYDKMVSQYLKVVETLA